MTYHLKYFLMPHPPIIIPEIGKGEEIKIQSTIDACRKIGREISETEPETIVVITPHGPVFSDAIALSTETSISGDLGHFGAPDVYMKLNIDLELTNAIADIAKENCIQTVKINHNFLKHYNRKFELDHGALIPLHFINQFYQNYRVVHITYGLLSPIELYQFGMSIKKAIANLEKKCVIIASGDLSHRLSEDGPYPYSPKGHVFDETILSYLVSGDTQAIFNMNKHDIEEAGECGYRSILILLGAMGKFKGNLLSYEGTFGVGYGVMSLESIENSDILSVLKKDRINKLKAKIKNSDCYVQLARKSLKYYFKQGKPMEVPNDLPKEMLVNRSGVFVSLKKFGNLRGCIGTFLPTKKSIAQEIIHNAIDAAIRDPRFSPVEEKELPDLDISVDILSEPMKASIAELNPKIYGVIVSQGRKRGLLLPDLEGITTVKQQLEIACQKAGIDSDKHFEIERFKVERHVEGELNAQSG